MICCNITLTYGLFIRDAFHLFGTHGEEVVIISHYSKPPQQTGKIDLARLGVRIYILSEGLRLSHLVTCQVMTFDVNYSRINIQMRALLVYCLLMYVEILVKLMKISLSSLFSLDLLVVGGWRLSTNFSEV